MKLTESTIKQLIKEEIEAVKEEMEANSVMDNIDEKLDTIITLVKAIVDFKQIKVKGIPIIYSNKKLPYLKENGYVV